MSSACTKKTGMPGLWLQLPQKGIAVVFWFSGRGVIGWEFFIWIKSAGEA